MPTGPARLSRRRRRLSRTALLGLVLALPACAATGVLVRAVAPPTAKPAYRLADRPTAILVVDSGLHLGDPTLSLAVANQIAADLRREAVVRTVVDPGRVEAVARQPGSTFPTQPLATLQRETGAQQVVWVLVERATFETQPGLYRPSAQAYVKVIDAASRQRLFPEVAAADYVNAAGLEGNLGFPVAVTLSPQALPEHTAQAALPLIQRRLADHLGRRVAELFYEHEVPTTAGR